MASNSCQNSISHVKMECMYCMSNIKIAYYMSKLNGELNVEYQNDIQRHNYMQTRV